MSAGWKDRKIEGIRGCSRGALSKLSKRCQVEADGSWAARVETAPGEVTASTSDGECRLVKASVLFASGLAEL